MKKIFLASLILLSCTAGARADCYMISYSITHNWAEGTCFDYKGNPYTLRTTYWNWVLDYGL